MSEKRRDNRNRILREGEYQRKEMRIKVDDLRRNTGLMRSYKKMTKILFVCHGNICRSPMAEFLMKELVRQAGQAEAFCIASAATSAEELGNPVYPPVRRKLAEHGIDCTGKTARQLTRRDYEDWDLLIGMDEENMAGMRRLFGGDPEGKLHMLLEYAGLHQGVADPWYTRDFDAAWQDVTVGCTALLNRLSRRHP